MLFDTESDGLVDTATKIHCVAAVDVDTGECFDWKPTQIGEALETIGKADVLIGHNVLRHDFPLMRKLKGFAFTGKKVDTMICARTIYPNVKETDIVLTTRGKMPVECRGKHTIEAWGYRLGQQKGDYSKERRAKALEQGITDPDAILRFIWGVWNEEMHEYMKQDVQTNLALWQKLRVDEYSQDAIELEHRIAVVCDQMERAGVPFNVEAAQRLHAELIQKKAEVEERLKAEFGHWYAPISPDPKRSTFVPKKDNAKLGYTAGAPMTKLKHVEFNPGSRDHIAHVLASKGWKPEKHTDSGKPKIDEETVAGVVERYPEFAGLGEYLTIDKRLSQLADGKQAWLTVVKPDGNVHGVINPMGTGTSRASHFYPNLAQVPAVKSPYGKECRDLFYARPGWKIVGADQQGLELRGLAHYLAKFDGGKYGQIVLQGDPHWAHAVAMGLAEGERDKHNQLHTIVREDGSKRFIYAYIYGCGNTKAGEIIFECVNKARLACGADGDNVFRRFFDRVDVGERALATAGGKVRSDFASRIEGFEKLQRTIAGLVAKHGWIPGLDKRRIPIKSDHSALNYLIQSAGAIICKRWVCDAFDECCRRFNYDWENPWNGQFVFGLWVHDEVQVWCREGIEDEVAKILVDAASKAGEPYGFRVRLDGEAKVGSTWAETH